MWKERLGESKLNKLKTHIFFLFIKIEKYIYSILHVLSLQYHAIWEYAIRSFGYVRSQLHIFHGYMLGNNPDGENKYHILLYWAGEIIGYGLLINFPLTFIFHQSFTVWTVIGWGIVWDIIKRFRGKE